MKLPTCPKCKSENYSFKRSKIGITWTCNDCGFKKINKTAEQLLKEDPISGSLKRSIDKLENTPEETKKSVTAKDAVDYIKSKTKKYKIIEKNKGFYQLMKGDDRVAEIIDRKKWLALYLKDNNFVVEKAKNEKEMKEVVKNLI